MQVYTELKTEVLTAEDEITNYNLFQCKRDQVCKYSFLWLNSNFVRDENPIIIQNHLMKWNMGNLVIFFF